MQVKPIELYNMEPIHEEKCLGELKGFYYNHIPEVDLGWSSSAYGLNNERVTIKCYKNHCFDGRRVWKLASVWLDEKPVMIIQNAGREGDDHAKKFVTNKQLYIEMINYIQSLVKKDFDDVEEYNENEDNERLITFYGYNLNQL